MKIIVAPNAFKDCLSAEDAARAIVAGVAAVDPAAEIVAVPVADGGDGLIDVFRAVSGAETIKTEVAGPCFSPVDAEYLFLSASRTAIIEMARASGLALLPFKQRSARATTTLGTGELALDAIRRGAKKIVVGIGGSATNDGGIGFAAALGARFLDETGDLIRPTGENLSRIAGIDLTPLHATVGDAVFEAVCDVDNPLCGPRGAAAVYGPQKGADSEDVLFLDCGLARLAEIVRRSLGMDNAALPGSGAAGGLGFGLASFVGATLRPGVEVVLDMVGIDAHLSGAALVITGEGRLDRQTAFGKAPVGVAGRAKRRGIPCIALAGCVADDMTNLHGAGIDAAFSLCSGPMTLDEAMRDGAALLANAAEQAFRAFRAGRSAGRR